MLVIRMEQLRAFEKARVERFVAAMIPRLRDEAPEVTGQASDEEIAALVRHGVARAAAYGLESAPQIAGYITCMTWLGPDFDTSPEHPWAAAILGDASLGPEDKLSRIEDYVMTHWEGARS
jgi:hypothetical protein